MEADADFSILLRLGAKDYLEGGAEIEDSIEAAQLFEDAGVDILDISGGLTGFMIPGNSDQGYFSPLTEAIRKAVSIPVILTGGITDPQAAEMLLRNEKADLIGVGRVVLEDSNWPARALKQSF